MLLAACCALASATADVDNVTSWAQLESACTAAHPSANIVTITLSPTFQMGAYTNVIGFSGKSIVIFGNNATLDANQKGRFFHGSNHLQRGWNTSLELHDITLQNAKVDSCGGAIRAWEADVKIYNSIFKGNSASDGGKGGGGAICVQQMGAEHPWPLAAINMEIYDSTFQNNSVTGLKGRISSWGGAISVTGSDTGARANVQIRTSEFKTNSGGRLGGGGGAILFQFANAEIHDSIFQGNSGGGVGQQGPVLGGAINVYGTADVKIYNSIFKNNSASKYPKSGSGGSIWTGKKTNVEIHGSIFQANYAASEGGAIYISDDGDDVVPRPALAIRDSTFDGNCAGQPGSKLSGTGGAIYVHAKRSHPACVVMIYTDCNFTDNGVSGTNDILQAMTFYGTIQAVTFTCPDWPTNNVSMKTLERCPSALPPQDPILDCTRAPHTPPPSPMPKRNISWLQVSGLQV
jgi:hypothetical protein